MPARDDDAGGEAGLRHRRQQARPQCRLGRGTARRRAEGSARARPRLRHRHHRLLDRRGRQPGRGTRSRGTGRSGRRRRAGRGPCPLPSRRHLAARTAPADLRQLAGPGNRCRADERRAGPDGVHRPALQRADPGPCRRLGRHQAPRVRHGVRRDEPGRVHRLPAIGVPQPRRRSAPTARSTSSAWTGATWPRCWRPARASTPNSRT